MAKHQFFNKENRTSFFLNFLAVVLGIVITFGGESLLSHKEERKNLNNCLELVSSELLSDRACMNYCDTLVNKEVQAALFLIKHERDYVSAPMDSLYAVANMPLIRNEISVYTDAFELLKNSGVLTKIKDKKLALEIFQTYDALNDMVYFINTFYEHKTKYLELAMNDDVKKVLAGDNVGAVELWSVMTSTKEGKQFLREIIRFLSSYDPTDVYEMVDNTLADIKSYTR